MTDRFDATAEQFNSRSSIARRRISLYDSLGLSMLYASAYFLPATASGAYFLPSGGFLRLMLAPTVVAVCVVVAVIQAGSWAARRWLPSKVAAPGSIVVLTAFSLIALKGLLGAAGYDWEDRLPRGPDLLTAQRDLKVMAFLGMLVLVWLMRRVLPQLTRLLGGLGFAFVALAVVRVLVVHESSVPATTGRGGLNAVLSQHSMAESGNVSDRPRRVIWVLFDETDLERLYDSNGNIGAGFDNFARLARASVFASHASSPASATLYSVPSLLTGIPLGGVGVKIDGSGALMLQSASGGAVPFDMQHSIFGAIEAAGRTSSLLGFLHPYCRLFSVQKCDSFHWPELGRWDSALWANVPSTFSAVFGRIDTWDEITGDSLRLLPEYLGRDDALSFLHLNFPHPPADFADRAMGLARSGNPLVEYDHNLKFTDRVLGQILQALEKQSARHDLLLVVSSDHWLRNMWYQATVRDAARPIPFVAWKVGETQGIALSQPLNTVHTAAMIIDFLNGKITSQTDIARWWKDKPNDAAFIVPNT